MNRGRQMWRASGEDGIGVYSHWTEPIRNQGYLSHAANQIELRASVVSHRVIYSTISLGMAVSSRLCPVTVPAFFCKQKAKLT
jgi:hypothetical protein